jgi:trans-aconitate methyltransferase
MRVVRDDPAHPDPGFAELYAALPYEKDLEPWLELAKAARPPVLYLGIGTGRIAVPLARAGVGLVGVDAHPGMLAVLRQRLPDVRTVEARIEDLQLRERFDLVIGPSHVLSTEPALWAARRHLGPQGMVALELMNPHWLSQIGDPDVRVLRFERHEADIEVDYSTGHTQVATVALVWPEEVEDFLAGAGLRLRRFYGGEEVRTSPTFCVVAAKARAGRLRSGSSGPRSR